MVVVIVLLLVGGAVVGMLRTGDASGWLALVAMAAGIIGGLLIAGYAGPIRDRWLVPMGQRLDDAVLPWWRRGVDMLVGLTLVSIGLFALYLVVKFIKWAWYV